MDAAFVDGPEPVSVNILRSLGIDRRNRFLVAINVYKSDKEFLKSLWGLGTEEEWVYRTGPPGYICWRNSFLGIDSWAP